MGHLKDNPIGSELAELQVTIKQKRTSNVGGTTNGSRVMCESHSDQNRLGSLGGSSENYREKKTLP